MLGPKEQEQTTKEGWQLVWTWREQETEARTFLGHHLSSDILLDEEDDVKNNEWAYPKERSVVKFFGNNFKVSKVVPTSRVDGKNEIVFIKQFHRFTARSVSAMCMRLSAHREVNIENVCCPWSYNF